MTDTAIKNVVIVGGGTAGWMAAAAIAHVLKNGYANITLIESEMIGTVGVGEATIPQIVNYQAMLGLDEDDFIANTNATFKLGIEFVNWSSQGSSYLHPFGSYGIEMDGIAFHHYWLKQREIQRANGEPVTPLGQYCLQDVAAKRGLFMRPVNQPNSPLAKIAYAFQFDAGLYAKYLRKIAEGKGVTRMEGRVSDVKLRSDNGHIEKLVTDDGREIAGDLFIDCSGFGGLLIEQALETGYEEWTHWLPCNRAVAVPCESVGDPEPYTRATAHSAGWQWRIPLQHRIGNGHVFSEDFMSADEATDILMNNLDGKPIADPRILKFTTGRRKKFWNKNCVAVGLAAGFMEPLESTSIHLAQSAIAKLLAFFPKDEIKQVDVDMFNDMTVLEYEQIRDFLILHYHQTKRTDSDFWNHVRTMDVPDNLKRKMQLYRETGRIFRQNDELFTDTSWLAVMEGQELEACAYHPVVDAMPEEEMLRRLEGIKGVIANSADVMPTHRGFIDKNCKADLA